LAAGQRPAAGGKEERGRAGGRPAMGPAAAAGKRTAAAKGGREGGAGGQPAMAAAARGRRS